MVKPPLRYHVRPGVRSLQEIGGQLQPGEILEHRNGALILHCPACRIMQMVVEELAGPPDAPSVMEPMMCGAGYCERCKAWFRIVRGEGQVLEDYDPGSRDLPAELRAAGVDYAPPLRTEKDEEQW